MRRRWRLLVYVWVLVCVSVLMSIPAHAQTEDPFSIRVESNLVLIHTEVYDSREMYDTTQAYEECRIADLQRFVSQPLSVPFTASDCFHYQVIDGLGGKDFHVLRMEWNRGSTASDMNARRCSRLAITSDPIPSGPTHLKRSGVPSISESSGHRLRCFTITGSAMCRPDRNRVSAAK
jgi:hypothetical protein